MTEAETKLLKVLTDRSFKRGKFPLASGGISDYYIDGKMTEVFSEAAFLIGDILYERTKALDIDAIGGLEVGAVPLTTAAVFSYHLHGQRMEGFWVREKAKTHGTRKLIEGNLQPRSRVVILDDVFTKGSSALKAVKAVKELECEVVLVLTLVDRLQGAEELFRAEGIMNYQSVFTIRDFGVEVDASKKAKQLLSKGSMVADNLRDTILHCDDWYTAEPSLTTFILRSLFKDLGHRDWDDQQGVPAADAPFQNTVLPHLHRIADILSATPSAEPIDELDELVIAYRDSIQATP